MIGNNSCGVHSVMAGTDRTTTSRSSTSLTYDGLRLHGRRTTASEELARSSPAGGRRGEIYRAAARRCATAYADEIRARYPQIPRRVSGYNLDELLPENGFHVARALVGHRGRRA